jgi:uncharacterized membrane protein
MFNMRDDSIETAAEGADRSRSHSKRPLHIVQFIAGLAMIPLTAWFLMQGDIRGGVLTAIVAIIAIAYAGMNLFVRTWP